MPKTFAEILGIEQQVPSDMQFDKQLLVEVRKFIIEEIGNTEIIDNTKIKQHIMEKARKNLLSEEKNISAVQREKIIQLIKDEMDGFGPITPLINDDNVSEIMVNGPEDIFIEKNGKIVKAQDIFFTNEDHIKRIIERMVNPLGKTIDASNPMVDARLPDGSRVNAIIPPLAINGPKITIRKFMKAKLTKEQIIALGTATREMMDFLDVVTKSKLNIVVSGGTGSGKTTLLNLISSFINNDERIITIEDAAELKLQQPHVVSLETKPATNEGGPEYKIRNLVVNALRMRPDRIIVGEVRGAEAIDMLQAMNTGHDGSLTTGHANSAYDMLFRLETMIIMGGTDLPLKAIRQQIARAINILVHTERLVDGTRRVTEISEIQGLDEKDDFIVKPIFTFVKHKNDNGTIGGEFIASGIVPKAIERIEETGHSFERTTFKKGRVLK